MPTKSSQAFQEYMAACHKSDTSEGAEGVAADKAMRLAWDKFQATLTPKSDPSEGPWVAACGGTEVPFVSRSGKRLLYVWQQSTGKHAYLDCDSDIILSDEDAALALMLF